MTNRARFLFLSLVVPLAAVIAVLLVRVMSYPAFGMGAVLLFLLLGLAVAIGNRFRGGAPERSAPPGPGATGCLVLVFLVLALAIVLPLDRPWNAPWWPGRHESGSLPGPCAVGLPTASALVPAGSAEAQTDGDGPYGPTAECTWKDPEGPSLRLAYELVEWEGSFGGTATDSAREVFANHLTTGAPAPLSGVGDEALRVGSRSFLELRARKANVIVRVTFFGVRNDAARDAALERLLRTAVDRVRTG
ncbi:hypothetical protein LUX05_21285 [Streptomyces somaliensis]|nr:hypothetical protein [Streptomyces somaliensis]